MKKSLFYSLLLSFALLFSACETEDDGNYRTIVNNSGRTWYKASIMVMTSSAEVPEYSFDVGTVKDGKLCKIDASSLWPYIVVYAKDANGVAFTSRVIAFTGSEITITASDFK